MIRFALRSAGSTGWLMASGALALFLILPAACKNMPESYQPTDPGARVDLDKPGVAVSKVQPAEGKKSEAKTSGKTEPSSGTTASKTTAKKTGSPDEKSRGGVREFHAQPGLAEYRMDKLDKDVLAKVNNRSLDKSALDWWYAEFQPPILHQMIIKTVLRQELARRRIEPPSPKAIDAALTERFKKEIAEFRSRAEKNGDEKSDDAKDPDKSKLIEALEKYLLTRGTNLFLIKEEMEMRLMLAEITREDFRRPAQENQEDEQRQFLVKLIRESQIEMRKGMLQETEVARINGDSVLLKDFLGRLDDIIRAQARAGSRDGSPESVKKLEITARQEFLKRLIEIQCFKEKLMQTLGVVEFPEDMTREAARIYIKSGWPLYPLPPDFIPLQDPAAYVAGSQYLRLYALGYMRLKQRLKEADVEKWFLDNKTALERAYREKLFRQLAIEMMTGPDSTPTEPVGYSPRRVVAEPGAETKEKGLDISNETREAIWRNEPGSLIGPVENQNNVSIYLALEKTKRSVIVAEIVMGHDGWANLAGENRTRQFDRAVQVFQKKRQTLQEQFDEFALTKAPETEPQPGEGNVSKKTPEKTGEDQPSAPTPKQQRLDWIRETVERDLLSSRLMAEIEKARAETPVVINADMGK